MIRRINKLKNVGRFVDLRSQGGNENEFAKLNVIYALNACGKTTLCDVFRSVGTGNVDYVLGRKRFTSTTPVEIEILMHGSPTSKTIFGPNGWQLQPPSSTARKILVYDDRFVADNVLVGQAVAVEQRRNLYGLALGEQGRLLKEAVDEAEQELISATSGLNTAKAALTSLIPAGYTIDTLRALPKDDSIDQHIKSAMEERDSARRKQQNADAIRQRKSLNVGTAAMVPDGIVAALDATLDDAAVRAEAYIRQHLEHHSHGLGSNWAEQGHRAQTDTTCPYCGQEMAGLEILAAYRAVFSGVLEEQQAEQTRILREAEERFGPLAQERLEQLLNSHNAEKDWWKDAGGTAFELPACPNIETVRAAMDAVRVAITGAIRRKQGQPSQRVVLTEAESESVTRWTELSASIAAYMAAIAPINSAIVDWQRAVETVETAPIDRQIAVLNAQQKRHDPVVVFAYEAFDTATAIKSEKEKVKTAANKALRDQSEQVLKDYGDRINTLLGCFGANFRLVSGGVKFSGGPPSGDLAVEILGTRVVTSQDAAKTPSLPSLANTLSGGDRSALGLAFFVAVAERDTEIADTIVFFDDPFHSQDRSRRRRTIECVHRIATASRQCFVLSHELDFAREAACVAGVQVRTYTLNPMTDHSVLAAEILPALPSRAYERDYAKLTAYVAVPANFGTQLKDIARCIRQTLEGYFRTKFPESWEEKDWLGDMIRKIREAGPSNMLHQAAHLVTDLTEVNDWGKRYYHGETDGSDAGDVDPTELKGYVEQTIGIISR